MIQQSVRAALSGADMVVFAAPIYWFDISAQLKLAIDRMYAFGGCGFNFSKVALLLNSGAEGVYNAAIAAHKAMNAYLNWEDIGIITIGGMAEKGDMAAKPRAGRSPRLGRIAEVSALQAGSRFRRYAPAEAAPKQHLPGKNPAFL